MGRRAKLLRRTGRRARGQARPLQRHDGGGAGRRGHHAPGDDRPLPHPQHVPAPGGPDGPRSRRGGRRRPAPLPDGQDARARVIGTAGTEEKAALAREAGADEVVLYREKDFAEETNRITGGEGVDVVYDSVGKDTFDRSLDCLKTRGYMVLFGGSSGQVPPFDLQVLNQKGGLYVTRPALAQYTRTREELLWRAESLFSWIGQGNLDVRIGGTYALEDAARAHRDLEGRKTTGKLILIP
nr:zinc-binding dehydrogenase [Rubrobacter tropicus]